MYKTKVDIIYDNLLKSIQDGLYRPGDRIVISQLAKDSDTSEIPVREAIRRLEAYRDAGADIVYADALRSDEELRAVGSIPGVYKFTNQTENGKTPPRTAQQLEEMGFNIVIFPCGTAFVAAKAMKKMLEQLKREGTSENCIDQMTTFHEFTDIVGLPELQQREAQFKTYEFR